MKEKFSYKSKKNIMIVAVIFVLLSTVSVATYFFVKGNNDASAFTGENMQNEESQIVQENEDDLSHNSTGNETQSSGEVIEPELDGSTEEEINENVDGEGEISSNSDTSTSDNQTEQNNSLSNSGTSNSTTGEVPNEEYVTERIEEEEVLVSEDYAVEWEPLTIKATTTTAELSIIRPIISQSKMADKTAVVENEIITYTIKVENSGTGNGKALVKDNMPMTSELVSFIDGSITIEGTDTIKLGDRNIEINAEEIAKLTAEDLNNGIEVNVPKATENDAEVVNGLVTISFKVQVKENVKGTIINQAEVDEGKTNEVKIPILTFNKKVDRKLLTIDDNGDIAGGNELEYTITVENTGELDGSITIKDSAPEGTEFVEESISISGTDKARIYNKDIEDKKEIEIIDEELQRLTAEDLASGIEVEVPAKVEDENGIVTLTFKVIVTDTSKTIENIGYVNEQPTNPVETKTEGLQITKTRTSIDDVEKVPDRTFVDQVGDVINYDITVKNIGNISAANITLKDDHKVTVTSVKIVDKDGNETVKFTGEKELEKNNDILSELDITIEPNETIVVEVEQTITQNDLDKALASDEKQTVNIATAKITGSEKGYTDQEETDVKERYPYIIKYLYNGVENEDERIDDDTALVGTIINLVKPDTKTYNGENYEYVTYYGIDEKEEGSTEVTTGKNVIEIHYGKPDTSILKTSTKTVSAGDDIKYTITVTNTGYVGTTITVTDTLEDTTYVESSATPAPSTNTSNKDLSWEITLDAATRENPTVTKTITFKATTALDSIGKTISNTAVIAEEPTKTSTTTTKVKEVVVNYNEFKQGQRTSDLNIIFIMDNSQSMNYPAKGYSYVNDGNKYPVAPSDREKTRLAASKSAINRFITNYPNSDISVITFNTKEPGTAQHTAESPYINYKTLVYNLQEATTEDEVGKEGYIYTKADGLKYTKIDGVEYPVASETELSTEGKTYHSDGKVLATDEQYYHAVIKPVDFGARLIGKASADNTTERNALKNSVNDIFISDSRLGLQTYVNPAFKEIVDNPDTYLSDTKKNVIIVIADGAFNDDDYMEQRDILVESDYWDKDEDEIYCIGLGGQGSPEYDVDSLKELSTNGKCEPADNTSSLLIKFNEIYTEATGKSGENESIDGVVELDQASQNVQYPIIATYIDENGEEKTLFTCEKASQKADYGLTVSGKNITWNARIFVQKQKVKVPDLITIKYHIPDSSTN